MDKNIEQIIRDKFNSLPKTIQEAIMSSDYENSLIQIGRDNKLTVGQMGILEREVTLVMMGLTPLNQFEAELAMELDVEVQPLIKALNEQIFQKIRDFLKTSSGEDNSKEIEPEESSMEPTEIKKSEEFVLNRAGIKINPVNASMAPKSTPTPAPKKADLNVLELKAGEKPNTLKLEDPIKQKLMGSVQMPTTKTEHTLNNLSSADDKTKKVADVVGGGDKRGTVYAKGDPYRLNPNE